MKTSSLDNTGSLIDFDKKYSQKGERVNGSSECHNARVDLIDGKLICYQCGKETTLKEVKKEFRGGWVFQRHSSFRPNNF